MKKKPLISMLMLALAVLLQFCSEEDQSGSSKERVQFTFALTSALESAGRASADDLPEGVVLRVSITSTSGDPVLTDHTITLLRMGVSYISQPLELYPGRYVLTDFMLVKDSTEVIYATPKFGSPLAGAVVHSLPYSFVVGKNKISNIAMEVIDVRMSSPEDFGYAAFNINIVNPWRISVFVEQDGKLVYTAAQAFLYQNSLLQYDFALGPKVNVLPFKGVPGDTYTLLVAKDGYSSIYSQSFKYEDIAASGYKPITVVLEEDIEGPAFTFEGIRDFWIGYRDSGTLIINWGDGQAEVKEFIESTEEGAQNFFYRVHEYAGSPRPVTITGDLHLITYFGAHSDLGSVNKVNTEYLTNLEALDLTNANIGVMDLSQNVLLNSLFFYQSMIEEITLASPHSVSRVWIEADSFTDEALLDQVYNNAIAQNITKGSFTVMTVEPLSEAVIQKLEDLDNNYQWSVSYPPPSE